VAIGRLTVRRASIKRLDVGVLHVGDLVVDRLESAPDLNAAVRDCGVDRFAGSAIDTRPVPGGQNMVGLQKLRIVAVVAALGLASGCVVERASTPNQPGQADSIRSEEC
jgi:hypothetical protein